MTRRDVKRRLAWLGFVELVALTGVAMCLIGMPLVFVAVIWHDRRLALFIAGLTVAAVVITGWVWHEVKRIEREWK